MAKRGTIFDQLDAVLDIISQAWSPLRGSRLMITGGSGFFGLWIMSAVHLLNAKCGLRLKSIILTRKPEDLTRKLPFIADDPAYRLIKGDVRSFELPDVSFDYLLHGATTSAHETFQGAKSLSKFDLLVDGTRHIMRAAELAKCKKALFLSSGAAYGSPAQVEPIHEDLLSAPPSTAPETGLAHGKRAAEFIFSEMCRNAGIDGKIGRCFSFVGAGLPHDIHYAIGNFVAAALKQEDIVIHSDGSAVRSYMDMRDFVIWLGLMLGQNSPNNLYNIGSPEAVSIRELAERTLAILGSRSQMTVKGNPAHAVGNQVRSFYVPCIDRFKADFSPPAMTPLNRAIADYASSLE